MTLVCNRCGQRINIWSMTNPEGVTIQLPPDDVMDMDWCPECVTPAERRDAEAADDVVMLAPGLAPHSFN